MASSNPIKVSDAGEAIGKIVKILQKCPFLKVNDVIKGGSLGSGVTVPGDFDADIVLRSDSLGDNDMKPENAARWCRKFDDYLGKSLHGDYVLQYKKPKVAAGSLSFTIIFLNKGKQIKFDFLPKPFFKTEKEFVDHLATLYNDKENKHLLSQYTAAAAKWQVKFISTKPGRVQDLIKRAKKWRNEKFPKGQKSDGRPKSYLISILVISASYDYMEELGLKDIMELDGKNVNIDDMAKRVTEILIADIQSHHELTVCWNDQEKHPNCINDWEPYVLDPANPFNNLYITGVARYIPDEPFGDYVEGNRNWVPLARQIETLDLTKSL